MIVQVGLLGVCYWLTARVCSDSGCSVPPMHGGKPGARQQQLISQNSWSPRRLPQRGHAQLYMSISHLKLDSNLLRLQTEKEKEKDKHNLHASKHTPLKSQNQPKPVLKPQFVQLRHTQSHTHNALKNNWTMRVSGACKGRLQYYQWLFLRVTGFSTSA